jgi:hypothetical protein
MDNVYVVVAAGLGAIVAGLLGWLESKEPFSPSKYWPTIIRAGLAAFLGALVTPIVDPVGWVVLGGAFVAGMGVDAGLKRAVGTIVKK